jgi:NADPH:quinone reductase-like Zn-dependent oxidoreductase
MSRMQAYVRTSAQDRDVELTNVPVPAVGNHEILVKVHAFGVGIHDRYYIPEDARFPYVIGTEAAGSVIATGRRATDFKPGARVLLNSVMQAKGGCWAEYVAVPESAVVALPDKMSFTEGAALPIAGKTAAECVRALGLASGDTLFIAGASGAVGTMVIQLAARHGIRVAGSASRANHAYMRSLGAEAVVDYAHPDWPQQIRQWCPQGVTAALAIQPGTAADSLIVVADGGRVITVSGDRIETARDIGVAQLDHRENARQVLAGLASDIVEGKVQLVIEHVYPFDQALDALGKTETRHARGKLVVEVDAD